ncbi:hypothetical protein [Acidovorax sp. BL-A-41-H1]|uniref:hypothetical protein n=1 Tax=Acidovorax sp. BL-A-41-H1 TaxID=3421102 RepID=UPI003F79D8BD
MTQPTDAELQALWAATDHPLPQNYARAVLAKWGTPTPAGEPVGAVRYTEGWAGVKWYAKAPTAGTRLYTTPPVREPLIETCEWTHDEADGFWETSCGEAWRFDDGGPSENGMKYCHSCGKHLTVGIAKGEPHADN